MERREFLRKTSITAGLASVPSVALASAVQVNKQATQKVKDISEPALGELRNKLGDLEEKFNQLDLSNKKTRKLVLIALGVSVGLDLSLLV